MVFSFFEKNFISPFNGNYSPPCSLLTFCADINAITHTRFDIRRKSPTGTMPTGTLFLQTYVVGDNGTHRKGNVYTLAGFPH
jgi:hypothetical protein